MGKNAERFIPEELVDSEVQYERVHRELPTSEFSSPSTSAITTEPVNIHGSSWVLQIFRGQGIIFP